MSLFATAIFTAEKISTKAEKFKALSGFGPAEKKLLWETFNPFRVFGVRQYDFPRTNTLVDPSYDQFFELLEKLATRQLTGTAARLAVTGTLAQYTEPTARALARVLNKDLDCGANRDSFEKIYTDLNIPKFELMLASKIEENAKTLTAEILYKKYGLKFPVLAESKYDGNRLLAVIKRKVGGLWDIEFLSRSGKPSTQYNQGIVDELIALAEAAGTELVVDGEILAGSFQETMNAKGSGNTDAKNALNFYVFDWMTVAEWEANHCPRVQRVRSETLEAAVKGFTKLIKSKYKICNSIQELKDFYAEVLAEGQNPDGTLNGLGEGLIVKNLDGFYEWDRSSVEFDRKTKALVKAVGWIKWKPVIDLDLEIVGWEYGKGRLSNTVGKVLLSGEDENGTKIEAACGSGFNDKWRAELLALALAGKLCGKILCIEAQEICKAANSDVHSARFPIAIHFRDDK